MYGDRYKFGSVWADIAGNFGTYILDKKKNEIYVSLFLYNTKVTEPGEVPAFVQILALLNNLPEETDDDNSAIA